MPSGSHHRIEARPRLWHSSQRRPLLLCTLIPYVLCVSSRKGVSPRIHPHSGAPAVCAGVGCDWLFVSHAKVSISGSFVWERVVGWVVAWSKLGALVSATKHSPSITYFTPFSYVGQAGSYLWYAGIYNERTLQFALWLQVRHCCGCCCK